MKSSFRRRLIQRTFPDPGEWVLPDCVPGELLKQPVSTDLPDLLRVLIAKIEALPEIVARAVKTGEIK